MALVDADYKFIYIDVSWNGCISDGGIFAGCILSETLDGRLADEDIIQIVNKIQFIVLMALVDADYKFIYIDVSWNGCISDGGIFAGCILSETLDGRLADEDIIQIVNKIQFNNQLIQSTEN